MERKEVAKDDIVAYEALKTMDAILEDEEKFWSTHKRTKTLIAIYKNRFAVARLLTMFDMGTPHDRNMILGMYLPGLTLTNVLRCIRNRANGEGEAKIVTEKRKLLQSALITYCKVMRAQQLELLKLEEFQHARHELGTPEV